MPDKEKSTNKSKKVSLSVIKRLPRYFRYIGDLKNSGVTRISSKELSKRMGITDSQIRQDLNCFGGFGQQGYGYNIESLYETIRGILGADCEKKAIIVGMGNLGTALAHNMNFQKRGVRLIGLFDSDQQKKGQIVNKLQTRNISELENFCLKEKPDIAVLTIPKTETQEMAKFLVSVGIKGFWNFANMELLADGAMVENVHMGDSLMMLCYSLNKQDEETQAAEKQNID